MSDITKLFEATRLNLVAYLHEFNAKDARHMMAALSEGEQEATAYRWKAQAYREAAHAMECALRAIDEGKRNLT